MSGQHGESAILSSHRLAALDGAADLWSNRAPADETLLSEPTQDGHLGDALPLTSGVTITDVRVSNFRTLLNVEVGLGDLTVLVGANNAGKTSFLDALHAAIGSGRRQIEREDIRLEPGEAWPPASRRIIIDIRIRPVGDCGSVIRSFPKGGYWTDIWSDGIRQDPHDGHDFVGIRTTFSWSLTWGECVPERLFLREWLAFERWADAATLDRKISTKHHIEPISLHYIDAKRDFSDDLHRPGSYWRRLTDDLGLPAADVKSLEEQLTSLNLKLVEKSEVLKHLKVHLNDIPSVVATRDVAIEISPIPRRLRDLSRGVDVSISSTQSQAFSLNRHGMGTRSLASLLVFRAYACWRRDQAAAAGNSVHTLLALEEPEAHLHPQAQRSLFKQVAAIPGQRIVSTHSPYFAGQTSLGDLRLFCSVRGDTVVKRLDLSGLDAATIRKLEQTVIDSRGDLLFARAVVFFEGQTEELALPIWAEKYWGASIHELGFCFVRVNGTDYFPFLWLAENLGISWFVLGDGEPKPVKTLTKAVDRIARRDLAGCGNVLLYPNGQNFETHLLAEGYLPEIEEALDECHQETGFLNEYVRLHDGRPGKGGTTRDYKGPDGRLCSALDALDGCKTSMARPLARIIASHSDSTRRFPPKIGELFAAVSAAHGLEKVG